MAEINDPGISERYDFMKPLWNPSDNGAIAFAKQVKDQRLGKDQSTINSEVQQTLEEVRNIAEAALIL